MNPHPRCNLTATRGAAMLLAWLLASAGAARADRIIYKDSLKVLEGVIQEQFPDRVKFLVQGRSIIIVPRERIERLIYEVGNESVETLLEKANTAVERGDTEQARLFIEKAREGDAISGLYTEEIQGAAQYLEKHISEGEAAARRQRADLLLADAAAAFDRVQNQKGLDLMLQALRIDPSHKAAHDEMADYMRRYRPNQQMATDYFCDMVDPDEVDETHPIIDWLPRILEGIEAKLDSSQTSEEVAFYTARLQKVCGAFAARPHWAAKSTNRQKRFIEDGADGILENQVIAALEKHRYQRALDRLEVWKPADSDPGIGRYYTRCRLGLGQENEAISTLSRLAEAYPEQEWVQTNLNSLRHLASAREATSASNEAEARGLIDALFDIRAELLPEISNRVSDLKIEYDVVELERLEDAGDTTAAAHFALRMHEAAHNASSAAAAADAFYGLAPQLTYDLNFVWEVDGQLIPLHENSSEIVAGILGNRFNLKFSNLSPFMLELRLVHGSFSGSSGPRLVEAAGKDQAYDFDFFDPDDSITQMQIELSVAHLDEPTIPSLYSATEGVFALADGVTLGRFDSSANRTVYFDLFQLGDIDGFLKSDFEKYLPPTIATIGNALRLPTKMFR